jgi:hypothetical protein
MGGKKKKGGRAGYGQTADGPGAVGQIEGERLAGQDREAGPDGAETFREEDGGGIDTGDLPPPESLARKKDARVKITIALNSASLEFFKKCAAKNGVKYQTMINGLLDSYAWRYRDRVKDG